MKTETLEYQITQQSNCKVVFSQDNDCFVEQIKSLIAQQQRCLKLSQTR